MIQYQKHNKKTIIALSSGRGGAISLIRLSGNKAIEIALKIINKTEFKSNRELKCLYDRHGVQFDIALLNIFIAPSSFTGEDLIEFNCHGNSLIVNTLLETAIYYGANLAEAGEFTERAFLNGKMSLLQAESIMDLISARNNKLISSAIYGLQGHLYKKVKELKDDLLKCLALIHGPLDFPLETEMAEINITEIKFILQMFQENISSMIKESLINNVFRDGLKVIIMGRPNVGKSSLLNLLVKQDRAIISDIEGTTRDFLVEQLLLKDIPLHLIDTAGLRDTTNDILEKMGIEKAINLSKDADLILFVFDSFIGWTAEDEKLFNELPKNIKKIIIANKRDLVKQNILLENKLNVVNISSTTKTGINELEEEIYTLLQINELEGDFNINLNQRQIGISHKINFVLNEFNLDMPYEFISVKIEEVLILLDELLGEKFSSDLALKSIFSNFCIGK